MKIYHHPSGFRIFCTVHKYNNSNNHCGNIFHCESLAAVSLLTVFLETEKKVMASMKTQKKDLYGNPTSSSSSSPDTSFSLDLDEPVLNTNRTTNTKSTSSTSSAYKEKKVVVRATKGQPKDITKSNIWTIIFGQARCSYGQKRGADKRWTTFNGDISISNITNAALTSLIIVVAPVLRKKDLQDKVISEIIILIL